MVVHHRHGYVPQAFADDTPTGIGQATFEQIGMKVKPSYALVDAGAPHAGTVAPMWAVKAAQQQGDEANHWAIKPGKD